MKKLSSLFLLALLPLMASAYDAQVDGVYYNLITKAKQAEVTSGDTKYTGSVTIPGSFTYNGVTYSVTSIVSSAFKSCKELTSVTIPNSVTCIGDQAFCYSPSLTSVTIGNGVTSIGSEAFSGCSSLTEVHITDIAAWCKIKFNTSSPYDYANPLYKAHHLYLNGSEIKDLVIPNSVTSIGGLAFKGCSGLTSVSIPNSVTDIGCGAFEGCSGLTSVTIPNSVTSIEGSAFEDCTGLTSVTIGNGVTSIGLYAFENCSGLTSVHITDIEAWCKIKFSNSYYDTPLYYAHHLYLNGNEIKDLVIPNSVTTIEKWAFYNCSGLTSVTIPNSVTTIKDYAFYGCSGLTAVTIGNSVKSIGKEAFYKCSGLTAVTIGNNVKSIGEKAFASCSYLAEVYCYAENVPSTNSDAFKDSYTEYSTLYVPEASVDAYKAAAPWSGFGTIKTLSGDIPVEEKCATPSISFVDGKLKFSCETEGVEYVYTFTPPSARSGSGTDITLPTTYKITVYATKSGYEDSDVATKEINVSGMGGIRGDVNNDGTVNMPDAMFIVNKILNGKFPDE